MPKHGFSIRLAIAVLALFSAAAALAEELSPEIEAVKTYILKEDYPELFNGSLCLSEGCAEGEPFRVRAENMLIADLDGDGTTEVVAQFHPHFLQSPTIVIYRMGDKGKVSRATEGLAPGRLVPSSGEYLDSHMGGWAIDFHIEDQQDDPIARKDVVKTALEDFGNVVEYLTFFHADGRTGRGIYVDMTSIGKEGLPEERTCEGFEFSRV